MNNAILCTIIYTEDECEFTRLLAFLLESHLTSCKMINIMEFLSTDFERQHNTIIPDIISISYKHNFQSLNSCKEIK